MKICDLVTVKGPEWDNNRDKQRVINGWTLEGSTEHHFVTVKINERPKTVPASGKENKVKSNKRFGFSWHISPTYSIYFHTLLYWLLSYSIGVASMYNYQQYVSLHTVLCTLETYFQGTGF